jgi:hypothetical protein
MLQRFSDGCTELLKTDIGERRVVSGMKGKCVATNPVLVTNQPNNPLVIPFIIGFKITTTKYVQWAQFLAYSKTEIPLRAVNITFYHMKPPHFLLPNNKQKINSLCFYLC